MSRWNHRPPAPGALASMGRASALIGMLALAGLLLTPLPDGAWSPPAPATHTYAEARSLAAELRAADGPDIAPECRSHVLDRGARTEHAVLLLHGFTSCPAQWDAVADAYAQAGYSVVAPRLPGHGARDRMTAAPSRVDAAELVAAGRRALAVAAGLGDTVTVVGISGGATLAALLADESDVVDAAVLISPLALLRLLPDTAVAPATRLVRVFPDAYLWWDAERREALASPPYGYPRYSLRALAAYLEIGRLAQASPPTRHAPLRRLVLVTNDHDDGAGAIGAAALASHLAGDLALDRESVDRFHYAFPDRAGYAPDLVDPRGANGPQIAAIYRTLRLLLDLPRLDAPPAGGPPG